MKRTLLLALTLLWLPVCFASEGEAFAFGGDILTAQLPEAPPSDSLWQFEVAEPEASEQIEGDFAAGSGEANPVMPMVPPEEYDLFLLRDAFRTDDGALWVQGSFGTLIETSAAQITSVGFDPADSVALELAPECAILLPEDLMNPVKNAPTEGLCEWFAEARAVYGEGYAFFARFSMDESGRLTALQYCYMP